MSKKINLVFMSILITVFFLSAQSLYAQERQWTVMIYTADETPPIEQFVSDDVAVAVSTSSYGLEEVSEGDLINFVERAISGWGGIPPCPALNYALILHNTASLYGGEGKLSIADVRSALESLGVMNGSSVYINLIGFDSDMLGMLEAAYEIKDWADVMVASEKDQPLGTWPYQDILDVLVADTEMTAAQLSQVIVGKYGADENDNDDNTLSSILLANYSTHDLAGDWYINYLRCGSEGDCEAAFGGMGIDERGNIVQWYGDEEFESPDPEMPTKIYIDSNGVVTIDSDELFIGFMSPDKKTVTATISDDDGADTAQIFVFQKRGEDVTFTLSDLAGDWNMHSFDCDSGGNCGWERGEAHITPGGVMTWTDFVDSDEGEAEEELQDSYLVSINWTDPEDPESRVWNGVVTIKEFYDEGDPYPFGAMSQSKNVIVGVVENDMNDSRIVIFQKKNGVVFDQTDLEGLWSMHGLVCQFVSGDPDYWQHIAASVPVIVIGEDMYGYDIEGGPEAPVGPYVGKVTIGEGNIIYFEEEIGEGETVLLPGTMSLDKDMIVFNGGEGDASDTPYQFLVFQRIRDVSPVQSLADAVSGFADAALNEEHDDWDVIFAAQQRAGAYENSDGSIFRDLKGFMRGVSDYAKNEDIFQSTFVAEKAFDQCIIAKHGSSEDNGLSIYLPRWYFGEYWQEEVQQINNNYQGEYLSFLWDIFDNGASYIQSWDEFLNEYIDTELIQDPDLNEGDATFAKTISGGTSASNYVMISSPLYIYETDPLADNLGDYDTELWRAFRWIPETESYDEYPFPAEPYGEIEVKTSLAAYYEENYMDPGKGLWLISRNDATLNIVGDMEDDYWVPYWIILSPGWNQVGTPFNFDIDWDLMDVYSPEQDNIYNILSDENIFTSHTLWRYSNGIYNKSGLMRRGESYWLKNLTNNYVQLLINPVRQTMSNDFVPPLERTLTLFATLSREETPPPPPGGMDPESEDEESSGGGSGCFIATACFGSPMAGEVNILRNFRDEYLLSNPIGQFFVSTYYKYSPEVADFIAKHDFLKTAVRTALYPVVKACPHTN